MRFDKLFRILEQRDISRTALIENGIVFPESMQQLLHNGCVSLRTLELICNYLKCEINDIAEL